MNNIIHYKNSADPIINTIFSILISCETRFETFNDVQEEISNICEQECILLGNIIRIFNWIH